MFYSRSLRHVFMLFTLTALTSAVPALAVVQSAECPATPAGFEEIEHRSTGIRLAAPADWVVRRDRLANSIDMLTISNRRRAKPPLFDAGLSITRLRSENDRGELPAADFVKQQCEQMLARAKEVISMCNVDQVGVYARASSQAMVAEAGGSHVNHSQVLARDGDIDVIMIGFNYLSDHAEFKNTGDVMLGTLCIPAEE